MDGKPMKLNETQLICVRNLYILFCSVLDTQKNTHIKDVSVTTGSNMSDESQIRFVLK